MEGWFWNGRGGKRGDTPLRTMRLVVDSRPTWQTVLIWTRTCGCLIEPFHLQFGELYFGEKRFSVALPFWELGPVSLWDCQGPLAQIWYTARANICCGSPFVTGQVLRLDSQVTEKAKRPVVFLSLSQFHIHKN